MLMTMTATAVDGRQTRFEQRMEVPGHGFLDVAANLDRTGMRTCLREYLRGGQLRSAMAEAKAYALPRLMTGIADRDTTPHSRNFEVGDVAVKIAIGA